MDPGVLQTYGAIKLWQCFHQEFHGLVHASGEVGMTHCFQLVSIVQQKEVLLLYLEPIERAAQSDRDRPTAQTLCMCVERWRK